MFKRIEKRQKKREEDDELGLDDETKQILGVQDTDSDESMSDSDDSDNSDGGVRTEWLAAEGDDDDSEDDEEGSDGDEIEQELPMTIEEALEDPIYVVSLDPEVKQCIICPAKSLKNAQTVVAHLESAAHKRRHTRFVELAKKKNSGVKDPRLIVARLAESSSTVQEGNSKRAEKRKQKLEQVKRKRALTKEIIERKRQRRDTQKEDGSDSGNESETANEEKTSTPTKKGKVSKPEASAKVSEKKRPEKKVTIKSKSKSHSENEEMEDGSVEESKALFVVDDLPTALKANKHSVRTGEKKAKDRTEATPSLKHRTSTRYFDEPKNKLKKVIRTKSKNDKTLPPAKSDSLKKSKERGADDPSEKKGKKRKRPGKEAAGREKVLTIFH